MENERYILTNPKTKYSYNLCLKCSNSELVEKLKEKGYLLEYESYNVRN